MLNPTSIKTKTEMRSITSIEDLERNQLVGQIVAYTCLYARDTESQKVRSAIKYAQVGTKKTDDSYDFIIAHNAQGEYGGFSRIDNTSLLTGAYEMRLATSEEKEYLIFPKSASDDKPDFSGLIMTRR